MNTAIKDFYDYLKKEMSEGKIDFSFRAVDSESGIDINIYPESANGETIDFSLIEYVNGKDTDFAMKCRTGDTPTSRELSSFILDSKNNSASMFGINYDLNANKDKSSTYPFSPFGKIAKDNHTSINHIKTVLKKYRIMTAQGYISEEQVIMPGTKDKICPARTVLFVQEKDTDKGIYGHEEFIPKLLALDNKN
jgi:hypothetical protein